MPELLSEIPHVHDTQRVSASPPITRADVLATLNELATVEHAVMAEYLQLAYVLGHGLGEDVPGPSGDAITVLAEDVMSQARVEMSHLLRVNRVLVLAGEPPQVDRAVSLDHSLGSAAATIFGPLGDRELLQLVERETALAAAVDARYAGLGPAVDPGTGLFEGDVLEALDFALASCSHHAEAALDLTTRLSELNAAEYLRVTRHEPADAEERSLLELSSDHYELVLAIVSALFRHDDEIFGQLRAQAVAAMENMDAFHALLVQRGLLPALAPRSPDTHEGQEGIENSQTGPWR